MSDAAGPRPKITARLVGVEFVPQNDADLLEQILCIGVMMNEHIEVGIDRTLGADQQRHELVMFFSVDIHEQAIGGEARGDGAFL